MQDTPSSDVDAAKAHDNAPTSVPVENVAQGIMGAKETARSIPTAATDVFAELPVSEGAACDVSLAAVLAEVTAAEVPAVAEVKMAVETSAVLAEETVHEAPSEVAEQPTAEVTAIVAEEDASKEVYPEQEVTQHVAVDVVAEEASQETCQEIASVEVDAATAVSVELADETTVSPVVFEEDTAQATAGVTAKVIMDVPAMIVEEHSDEIVIDTFCRDRLAVVAEETAEEIATVGPDAAAPETPAEDTKTTIMEAPLTPAAVENEAVGVSARMDDASARITISGQAVQSATLLQYFLTRTREAALQAELRLEARFDGTTRMVQSARATVLHRLVSARAGAVAAFTGARKEGLQGAAQRSRAAVRSLAVRTRAVMADDGFRAIAAPAAVGAATVGAGGGAVGLTAGVVLGGAAGLIPAVFTFGLSVPIGAALGGACGLVAGTTVGSAAGAVAGGSVGYGIYARGGQLREGASQSWAKARGSVALVRDKAACSVAASAAYVQEAAGVVRARLVGGSTGGTDA